MNLQFSNLSGSKATMLLYKHIGDDNQLGMGIDGNYFASELLWLNEQSSVSEIEVRINSIGGSVQEGLSICSAILNSAKPVITCIDGMAYSMAGVIAMCGTKKKMVDYGTFMMHNAQGGNNEEVLNLITNSLAKIFERCTSLTMDKCKQMMADETWMDAAKCMEMGLIDEIITTNNRKPMGDTVVELYNIYNKLLNKKQMIKVTNLLNLSNDATEEAIVESIQVLETAKAEAISETETLKSEIETLKEKLKSFEEAELAKAEAEKLEVIENAISEKKIDATKKDHFINCTMGAAELKDLFGAIKIAYTPVFNAEKVEADKNDRSSWTFRTWEKKDPAGLNELMNSAPEAYKELLKTIGK